MKTSTTLYTNTLALFCIGNFISAFKKGSLSLLMVMVAFTLTNAQGNSNSGNGFAYGQNAVLNSPVNYQALANFLQAQLNAAGNSGNKGGSGGQSTLGDPGNPTIVSPTFGAISGPDSVCHTPAQTVSYSVAISSVNGSPVQFYWFVPADWTIVSGQGTASIQVIPGQQSGQVAVFAIGFCICTYSCMPVTSTDCSGTPACPEPVATVSGNTEACSYEENVVYTANVTQGQSASLTYSWTVPADWFVMSRTDSSSIVVMPGSTAGNVSVTVTNSCGNTTAHLLVTPQDCGNIFPLPVELISFEAARAQSAVLLNWATAQELNNDHFVVERSTDGRNFEAIGRVAGKGTTSQRQNYSYTDGGTSASVAFYRLKQVDTDGKFEYSPIRSVKQSTATAKLEAFPNPTSGVISLQLEDASEDAQVKITSVTGQTVWQGSVRELAAKQNRLDISHLNAGIYVATVSSDGNSKSLRIIKN